MNKKTYFLVVACMLLSILMSLSCVNEEVDNNMNEVFFGEFVIDDSQELKNVLTREYDINELQTYFEGKNTNENIVFNSSVPSLVISDVNQHFPIEVIRSGGYSVYKVIQGGYFYVFWAKPYSHDTANSKTEPSVYFTSYLASSRDYTEFDSLEIEVSTAKDVKELDSSFELSFLISNGILSYSFLDDDSILMIEYTHQGIIVNYDDLVVKKNNSCSKGLCVFKV